MSSTSECCDNSTLRCVYLADVQWLLVALERLYGLDDLGSEYDLTPQVLGKIRRLYRIADKPLPQQQSGTQSSTGNGSVSKHKRVLTARKLKCMPTRFILIRKAGGPRISARFPSNTSVETPRAENN